MISLFTQELPPLGEEAVHVLEEDDTIRIERIVSNCAYSPADFWYDQEEMEWVSVLEGDAVLRFEDRIVRLRKGDSLTIQRHERHRVESTSSGCVWLCVFWK